MLVDHDGWWMWRCCHPLDEPGEEDRMTTRWYAEVAHADGSHDLITSVSPSPGET